MAMAVREDRAERDAAQAAGRALSAAACVVESILCESQWFRMHKLRQRVDFALEAVYKQWEKED